MIYNYEDLLVWQKAMSLCEEVRKMLSALVTKLQSVKDKPACNG